MLQLKMQQFPLGACGFVINFSLDGKNDILIYYLIDVNSDSQQKWQDQKGESNSSKENETAFDHKWRSARPRNYTRRTTFDPCEVSKSSEFCPHVYYHQFGLVTSLNSIAKLYHYDARLVLRYTGSNIIQLASALHINSAIYVLKSFKAYKNPFVDSVHLMQ